MWECVISAADLAREGSWTVERFAEVATAGRPTSAYATARLGDLVREIREMVPAPVPSDQELVYLGLEHIEPLTGDLVGYAPRAASRIRSRAKNFREGHVLYGRLRPGLNKVYFAEVAQVAAGLCSGELLVLEANLERVLPRVLRQLLASPFILDQAVRLARGAALPRVSAADLLELCVPLPPLEHQRILDHALREADVARRALRAELEAQPAQTMRDFLAALASPP